MNLYQAPMKTTKGLQEVGNRLNHLSMDARRILIMINGKSTVGELSRKLAKFGPIESILEQLETEGFISPNPTYIPPPETSLRLHELSQRLTETGQTSRPTPAASHPAPADSPRHLHPNPADFNLEKAKGFIRFVLFGAMGPTAERRINRVDATTSPDELHVELDGIRAMLPTVLSKKEAQQAWRQLEPIMQSLDMLPV